MTTEETTRQLDVDRMDTIIFDLNEARLLIMQGKRKAARDLIDLTIKDLQTQSWMLNTPDEIPQARAKLICTATQTLARFIE